MRRARDKANGHIILPSKVNKAINEMVKKNINLEREKLYLQYMKDQQVAGDVNLVEKESIVISQNEADLPKIAAANLGQSISNFKFKSKMA